MKIGLITEFFYPNIGGVESHVYFMAYCFKSKGHDVVIISRSREEKYYTGVRYFNNGIKVYYLPSSFPTVVAPGMFSFRVYQIKNIILRE